ncbi:MAG: HlyD family efflux transporter periplasmic adaptor subunit [Planctomycetes bacterium]|nr:HlyD family efflux transporter periplasmic adaptor subunit [Planctomycetota bacterium]
MKSRLLPPPISEEREFNEDSPLPVEARRASDQLSDKVVARTVATAVESEAVATPVGNPARCAPQVSARPKGRLVVAAILLVCVGTVSYFLWSTFLRDAAYGVVTGKVTALSPPWSGTLTAVYASAGDTVRQGEVLVIVDDPELQASIDRLSDDLRTAQAELDAQAALIALAASLRGNDTEESRADYFDLRGELLVEQSRYDELSSRLRRRQALAARRAISHEEVESLRFVRQGLAAKIENLQQAITALETRLKTTTTESQDAAQLKPYLAKIENCQAEIRRLRDKQRRGMLRAPFSGTVVDVVCHVGERAIPEQPLLEILPENSLELVLYVMQDQASTYKVGQRAEVVVEPAAESIVCRVTRIGQRMEKPQSHVAGRYRPEEKLLPIYLTPTADLPMDVTLRIGSTVRLPATLLGN